MVQETKIINQILSGVSDDNISFKKICKLLVSMGFKERIKGSHHIFFREDIAEIINIQSKGSKSKPYQVRQVRNIILKYKLKGTRNEQL